ncbi:MAG: lycopene cyclase [Actinomycetales bacterium]|nr:MAG: lycopene cyclase [Actinomycetales bacterium]
MASYQYLLLMAGCVLITLPLEFFFQARVYRRWRQLLMVLLVVVTAFVLLDLIGIIRNYWTYSAEFTTGIMLGWLPLEELVFFIVIPICGLLSYEAVGFSLNWWRNRKQSAGKNDA